MDTEITVQCCAIRRCQYYLIYTRDPMGFHNAERQSTLAYMCRVLSCHEALHSRVSNGPTRQGSGLPVIDHGENPGHCIVEPLDTC